VHDDRFALDFKLPLGTEVIVSKSGIVWKKYDGSSVFYLGDDIQKGMKPYGLCIFTNLIIISHEDGSHTLYSHLEKESILVDAQEEVEQGQPIARTGMSGWIGPLGPHLHFEPYEITEMGERRSFPVIFDNYHGALEHRIINELESA